MFRRWSVFSDARDGVELASAQARALSKQLPLMYLILTFNSLTLAHTFFGRAPIYLTVYVPVTLCLLTTARLCVWLRRRNREPDPANLHRMLNTTVVVAGLVGTVFTIWGLNLAPYGDTMSLVHLEFYVTVSVISCLYCLFPLPAAAIFLSFSVLIPYLYYFMWHGHGASVSVAISGLFSTSLMVVMTLSSYRDLVKLVRSKQKLTLANMEMLALSDENRRMANVDSLTKIPNRRHFFSELDSAIERARAHNRGVAVGLVDLDGFKPVNDIYGHAIGDDVLVEAARRLVEVTQGGFVARLGGDEFAFILPDAPPGLELEAYGRTVCRALALPYALTGVTAKLSASVGISVFPEAGDRPGQLVERADYALYHAKKQLGCAAVFSTAHERELKSATLVNKALREADLERELSVVFQPVVDSHTGLTLSFEALARWESASLGAISPSVFIPAAERLGIMPKLTLVLLAKALAAAADWPKTVRMSFNLSTRDLMSGEEITQIVAILKAGPIAPHRIDFEVTETSVISDFTRAVDSLCVLRFLGCGVSLDDFGTGHSSLSYVHRLPLDKIKIDKSFVDDIAHDFGARNIIKTVVDMSRNLRLACVVEGVESEEQLMLLRTLGCRYMQGYLYSRPLAAEAVAEYLQIEASRQAPSAAQDPLRA